MQDCLDGDNAREPLMEHEAPTRQLHVNVVACRKHPKQREVGESDDAATVSQIDPQFFCFRAEADGCSLSHI